MLKKMDKTFNATGKNYGSVKGDRTIEDIKVRRQDRWNFLFIAGMCTPTSAGSDCPVALGREDQSIAELLAWLTGPMARPPVGDNTANLPPAGVPVNRFAGLAAIEPVTLLAADLDQLQTDLSDATAQLRLRLTAISANE